MSDTEGLTAEQLLRLRHVHLAQANVRTSGAMLDKARANLYQEVTYALDAGLTTKFLAGQLGVAASRIYQMRTQHEKNMGEA